MLNVTIEKQFSEGKNRYLMTWITGDTFLRKRTFEPVLMDASTSLSKKGGSNIYWVWIDMENRV